MEDELESCRDTIRKLQEVIASPSADKKTSALNRLFAIFINYFTNIVLKLKSPHFYYNILIQF